MRILFWNTYRNKAINKYVFSLVQDYNIDILGLAEYRSDEKELWSLCRNNRLIMMQANTKGSPRLNVWSNYVDIKEGQQHKYYSIQIIQDKYIICFVHLFTDLYGQRDDERLKKIEEIMYDIQTEEQLLNTDKTIIIGDINEMPYGKGCLSASGFHGLPALSISDKPLRTVYDNQYKKYYNPMWNLMGDFEYPPGTYYWNEAKLCNPMWYMLDQVIISQGMVPALKKDKLKIITTCSAGDLMYKNGHPDKNISDHFPIMCEFDDEILK